MRTSLLVGIGIGFFCLMILYSFGAPDVLGAQERFIIKGAEVSKPVKPTRIQRDLRTVPPTVPWRPGDPVSEEPRALSPSFELVPITPEIVPAPPDGKEERSSALRGPGKISSCKRRQRCFQKPIRILKESALPGPGRRTRWVMWALTIMSRP